MGRKPYTGEFKREAVRLAKQVGASRVRVRWGVRLHLQRQLSARACVHRLRTPMEF